MRAEAMEELRELLLDSLHTLIEEQGFAFPIVLCAIGANTSVMVGIYTAAPEGPAVEFVAEHIVDGGIALPTTLVYSDSTGRVALIQLASGQEPRMTLHS